MKESPTFIKKLQTESIVQQIINALTDAIIDKNLLPGDRLPSEPEMAEQFGVARSSIREAVKILAYLGVLESRRAEGTFVADGFRESMIDPMVYGIFLSDSKSFDHLTEVREMIEVGIVRLARTNKDEDGLNRLKKELDQMMAISGKASSKIFIDKMFEADNRFHNVLAEICQNPIAEKLDRIVRTLTHAIRYDTVKTMLESNRVQEFFDAHQNIYALVSGETTASPENIIRETYFLDTIVEKK